VILLDTNVLSELVKPQPDLRVVSWTRRSSGPLAVPTIAVAEMAFGIEKLVEGRRRDELLQALRRLVVGSPIACWISTSRPPGPTGEFSPADAARDGR
jgi:predicted nucleic acid-binding protein